MEVRGLTAPGQAAEQAPVLALQPPEPSFQGVQSGYVGPHVGELRLCLAWLLLRGRPEAELLEELPAGHSVELRVDGEENGRPLHRLRLGLRQSLVIQPAQAAGKFVQLAAHVIVDQGVRPRFVGSSTVQVHAAALGVVRALSPLVMPACLAAPTPQPALNIMSPNSHAATILAG
jgi:hypothetical protein